MRQEQLEDIVKKLQSDIVTLRTNIVLQDAAIETYAALFTSLSEILCQRYLLSDDDAKKIAEEAKKLMMQTIKEDRLIHYVTKGDC